MGLLRNCGRAESAFHIKASGCGCASGLKEEVSIQVVELLIEGARVGLAVGGDGDCLGLLDVSAQHAVRIERLYYVEVLDGSSSR